MVFYYKIIVYFCITHLNKNDLSIRFFFIFSFFSFSFSKNIRENFPDFIPLKSGIKIFLDPHTIFDRLCKKKPWTNLTLTLKINVWNFKTLAIKKNIQKIFFSFFTKKKVLGFFPGFSRLKGAKKKFRYFLYLPWDFLCISRKIGKVKDFYYTFIAT